MVTGLMLEAPIIFNVCITLMSYNMQAPTSPAKIETYSGSLTL